MKRITCTPRASLGTCVASIVVGLQAWMAGCTGAPVDGVGAASTDDCDGPDIALWYGDTLHPDLWGHPQRQVNVLGNVSDHEAFLRYALEGGPFTEAPLGRDLLRLDGWGDFNIEIDRADLEDGENTLELVAEDDSGATCSRTVTIHHDSSARWPMPHSDRFDSLGGMSEIEDAVQVVDGRWEVTSTGLRIVERGYDRLLAIGDRTWEPGYEARATVTLHHFGDWEGLGIAVGWQGHTGDDDPATEWPLGALGWARNKTEDPSFSLTTYDQGTKVQFPMELHDGETYVFRIRCEPAGPDEMDVAVKLWNDDEAEPEPWLAEATVNRRRGSVLLVTHGADATWHDIDIRSTSAPLDGGMTPTDGGTLDGGTTDGGTVDGGIADAGSMDAGTVDGGIADAGTMDAGTLDGGIADAGTTDAGTGDAATDGSGRSGRGLIALYELEEHLGNIVRDTGGGGTHLDLTIEDPDNVTWIAGGLSVDAPTRIVSDGSQAELVESIIATNEVTIEAWVRSHDLDQDGPARIVSLSGSPYARNFTLGQGLWGSQPSDLVDVRLRTTDTNANGQPSLSTQSGTLTDELTHVVYTRDATGTMRIYLDGVEEAQSAVAGDLSSWDPAHVLALANEVDGSRPWRGELHLVALFDRALSDEEVARHFAAGPNASSDSTPNQPPVAQLQAEPTSGTAPLSVELDGSDSRDPDGSIVAWDWDFGDGATATGPTPSHTFQTPGRYDVTLTVTDDAGATATDVQTVAVSSSGGRITAGLQALYELDEGMGSTVHDTSGTGTPIDLFIEDASRVSWQPEALSIDMPTRVHSDGPARRIHDAVVASGEITVEAWVSTDDLTQDGPARIVSISNSPYSRNLTLGQGLWGAEPTDRIDVRLRTSMTSANGTPSATTPAGTLSTGLTHVVYTRDAGGTARIYIDGVERTSELVDGDLSAWHPDYPLVLANEVGGDRPWLGTLHLIAIFDRALSAEEVEHNFAVGPD